MYIVKEQEVAKDTRLVLDKRVDDVVGHLYTGPRCRRTEKYDGFRDGMDGEGR